MQWKIMDEGQAKKNRHGLASEFALMSTKSAP